MTRTKNEIEIRIEKLRAKNAIANANIIRKLERKLRYIIST